VSKKIKETRDKGFEESLAELEKLVTAMERGELPLDEALRQFERGVQLTRECQAALQVARQKVQILQQSAAGPVLAEFDAAATDTRGA
jgi:exodeoxyribonuclease VII small subunit